MKIAILTYLMDFNPGYSLTGIVYDQSKMLTRHGHEVVLYVSEQFNPTGLDFSHVGVRKHMPFAHLKDYASKNEVTEDHKETTRVTAQILAEELGEFDAVFTHDLVFTGWFLPYGQAVVAASSHFPQTPFLHWVHSIPSGFRDWWDIKRFGVNHKIVFPNQTDRLRVAEQYRGEISDVRVIPHIKDPRHWLGFHEDTCKLIDMVPRLLDAHVVAVLPAGTDRLDTKGTDKVIRIMAEIKKLGLSVCLVIANQWATGRQRKQTLEPYIQLGQGAGLEYGTEFVFTSDLDEDWKNGLPAHMIRELFQLSNLFIFPTHCESFGLVVPEAILSGAVLPVLNDSLQQQREISGNSALYFNFGSHCHGFTPGSWDDYFRDLAVIIMGRMRENESIKAATFVRRELNMDKLYRNAYLPVIMELRNSLKGGQDGQSNNDSKR